MLSQWNLKTLDGRWALGVVIRWLRNFYQTTYTADGQKILTTAQLGVHTKTYTMDFFMTRSIYYHLLPSMKKALSSKVYKKISLHFWWEGNSFYDRYLIIHRCICQSNWVFLLIIDANDSMLLVMDFRATLHSTNISRVSLSFFAGHCIEILSKQMDWPL